MARRLWVVTEVAQDFFDERHGRLEVRLSLIGKECLRHLKSD